jgi:cyclase
MMGYDIPLIKAITSAVNIPVIALGGAGKFEDLSNAIHLGGASAAAAGSMFVYFGKKRAVLINYPDRKEIDELLSIR